MSAARKQKHHEVECSALFPTCGGATACFPHPRGAQRASTESGGSAARAGARHLRLIQGRLSKSAEQAGGWGLTRGITRTYGYDPMGNLLRVEIDRETGSDTSIEYQVDALGRRVGRMHGTTLRQYVWDGQLRIAATIVNGTVESEFVYTHHPSTPDLVRQGTKVYRIITDERGTPLVGVDTANGDVWFEAEWDEWGNLTSLKRDGSDEPATAASYPIPQGFAGGLFDPATGLTRFGVRDYDPNVGRWTSKDPILFAGGQGNLYVYVGNDPVGFVDPGGHVLVPAVAAGATIGAVVNTVGYMLASGGNVSALGLGGAIVGGALSGAGAALGPWGAAAGGALGAGVEGLIGSGSTSLEDVTIGALANVLGAGMGDAALGGGALFSMTGLLTSQGVKEVAEDLLARAMGRAAGGELSINVGIRAIGEMCGR